MNEIMSRNNKFWQGRWFVLVNSILLFFLLNGVFSQNSCQLDLSLNQVNSLSASSEKVFSRLDQPILIEAYISQNVPGELHRGFRPILANLRAMQRLNNKNIIVKIIDPRNEQTQAEAKTRGLQGVPIEEQKELSSSVRLGYYGVYLQRGTERSSINLIANNWFIDDFEYQLLREIKKLSSEKTMSEIGLASGSGLFEVKNWNTAADQSKDNLYGFKSSIEQDLGTIEELKLTNAIPNDVQTLLIVGGPEFTDLERYNVDQFLISGGNVVAMLRAFDFPIEFRNPQFAQYGLATQDKIGLATINQEKLEQVNQWIGSYGLFLRGEILFEPQLAMPVIDIFNNFPRQINYPAWAIYGENTGNFSKSEFGRQLIFPWYSGLRIEAGKQSEVEFETLVETSPSVVSRDQHSLAYADVHDIGKKIGYDQLGKKLPVMILAKGEFQSAFTQATIPPEVPSAEKKLFRNKTISQEGSNLVLVSTPYLVSDILLKNQSSIQVFQVNRSFLINLMETLSGDTDLLNARSKRAVISKIPTFSGWIETVVSWFFVLIFPLTLSMLGTFRLLRRNRFADKR